VLIDMEPIEYETMFHREENYWWYVGLHDLVKAQIAAFLRGKKSPRILDAGCGTGKLLDYCREYKPFGLEYSGEAFKFLSRRKLGNIVRASICRIPFADSSFDLVASMDVIYTVQAPDDLVGLREMSRVLKPGGILLLNLPAYEFLRSHHDAAVHTRQRYTGGRLRTMLRDVGLTVKTISYRNTMLFPIAAGIRLLQKLSNPHPDAPSSDLQPLPKPVNWALTLPLLVENRLIRLGGRLPFGLSVYGVAVKG